MQGVTIKELERELADNLERQEVLAIVLGTVEEMAHYKQVNKRFLDRLKEKGGWAYISEGYGSKTLRMEKERSHKNELSVYSRDDQLTWDGIRETLQNYKLHEYEQNVRQRIACHAQDVETLKEILAFLDTKPTKNFHRTRMESDIRYAIQNSAPREDSKW